MAREWKFETALDFIREWSGKDTDVAGVSDDYLEAEDFILDAEVHRADEMAGVIEVVIDNVLGGTRSDGRDVRALRAVMERLREGAQALKT